MALVIAAVAVAFLAWFVWDILNASSARACAVEDGKVQFVCEDTRGAIKPIGMTEPLWTDSHSVVDQVRTIPKTDVRRVWGGTAASSPMAGSGEGRCSFARRRMPTGRSSLA